MPKLIITTRNGQEQVIEAEAGRSLMEEIRRGGIDELEAQCGGCASCCTCHVHVAEESLAMLPPMEAQEDDLLSCSDQRNASSRLACQIRLTDEMDGLRATVAEQ
jgi:2Fe-2S ferredoxin